MSGGGGRLLTLYLARGLARCQKWPFDLPPRYGHNEASLRVVFSIFPLLWAVVAELPELPIPPGQAACTDREFSLTLSLLLDIKKC